MVKKILAMLLVAAMVFSLAACSGNTESTSSTASTVNTADVSDNSDANNVATTSKTKKKKKKKKKTNKKNNTTSNSDAATDNGNGNTGTTGNNNTGTTSTNKTAGTLGKVDGNKTTGTDVTQGNTNTSTEKSVTVHAANNLNVKTGSSVAQNVNIKGKTITMALTSTEGQYHTGTFKRTIKAFEKKYGCTVKTINLGFDTYNTEVAAKIRGKQSPDIAYVHGSMFPACAIDGIYEDLLPYLRSDDLMDNNDPLAGGIDLNKTSYYVFGGKLYGTCNYSSVFPNIIYYNKKMFQDEGISDPRKLSEKGKWTWEYIEKLGKKYSKPSEDKYFLGASFVTGRFMNLAYGAPLVVVENGKYKQNIDSPAYIASSTKCYEYIHTLKIAANPSVGTHGYGDNTFFVTGGSYMWEQESSKYVELVAAVRSANAFAKDKTNIGIVDEPLDGKYNKNRYPTGWLTAVACGKGKDPRVAIAWDVFRSTYKDPQKDSDDFNDTDKAFVNSLLKGDIACEVGSFSDSSTTSNAICANKVQPEIRAAGSTSAITSIINKYKGQVQACVDATMKKS